MKKLLTALFLATVAFACQKDPSDPKTIPCTGDCLFTLENAEGTMVKMSCFNRFGIQIPTPNASEPLPIYGIPDELSTEFEQEGKAVRFSAAFRANTLALLFPDPSFDMNSLYQIKLTKIEEFD